MIDSTEFASCDEFDEAFFSTFDVDASALTAEASDPDLFDDEEVPY